MLLCKNRDWQGVQSSVSTLEMLYLWILQHIKRCFQMWKVQNLQGRRFNLWYIPSCEHRFGQFWMLQLSLLLCGFSGACRNFFERVRSIWNETLSACELNENFGTVPDWCSGRWDVEAASVLDLMTTQGVKVDIYIYHLTSAIRACWGFGKTQHRAANCILLICFQV